MRAQQTIDKAAWINQSDTPDKPLTKSWRARSEVSTISVDLRIAEDLV